MSYKNLDIVFVKKLTSLSSLNQVIHLERITSESIEMTFDLYSNLIKTFISSKNFLVKVNEQNFPLQVSEAFNEIRNKNNFVINDFEELSSTLKYYNYELFIVARKDLSDSEVELDEDYYWRSYAIDNYSDNPIGLSNYYTGYSVIAHESSYLFAMDYIPIYNLSSAQLEEYDLENSRKSYEFLSANGGIKDFDDTNSLEYLKSRGVEYKLLVNYIS